MKSHEEMKDFLDEVDSIHREAEEYNKLKAVLSENKDFMALKKHLLAVDSQDCLGPWLGGDYYDKAIEYIITNWAKQEKTESSKAIDDLMRENETLKHNIAVLKGYIINICSTLVHELNDLFITRSKFGDYTRINLENWVKRTAKYLNEEGEHRDKAED